VDDACRQEKWERIGERVDRNSGWTDDQRRQDDATTSESIGEDTADRIKGEIRQRIGGDRNANQERRPAKLLRPWPNDRKEGKIIDEGEEDSNVDGGAVPSGERCGGHRVSIAYLC